MNIYIYVNRYIYAQRMLQQTWIMGSLEYMHHVIQYLLPAHRFAWRCRQRHIYLPLSRHHRQRRLDARSRSSRIHLACCESPARTVHPHPADIWYSLCWAGAACARSRAQQRRRCCAHQRRRTTSQLSTSPFPWTELSTIPLDKRLSQKGKAPSRQSCKNI